MQGDVRYLIKWDNAFYVIKPIYSIKKYFKILFIIIKICCKSDPDKGDQINNKLFSSS